MKKEVQRVVALLSVILLFSCTTSNDSNGNSTTTAVPLPPTNLTGTVFSTTQINLSWTDNSTNETGFKIERRTGSGIYAVVGTVNADVLSFNDIGLTPNTTYTYRVYSYNVAGNSSTYSNEFSLTIYPFPTASIGTQVWMQKNLELTTYRNGDVIPQVTDPTAWSNLTTGAWCYYNNDSANGVIYGKLYNWYAVTDSRGLAPVGWHVSTDAEWTTLTNYLGGLTIAGGAMKETGTTHWLSPNTGATNSSGFTGLPGGNIHYNGTIYGIGSYGYWWSSSAGITTNANTLSYNNSSANIGIVNNYKTSGFSVRCLKD